MAITSADVQLLESERMTDSTDGGGRMTANAIPDGVNGNIFPKVSRLDAVYGRVNLRKIYGQIRTDNVDTYAGSHLIVTDPPDNARVSVCAFSTRSYFDNRTTAKDRIESYVLSGPEARLRLYGRQPAGAKTLLCYQRKGEGLPDIGDVFALTQLTSQGVVYREQYVRVDEVSSEVREFEDDRGVYTYAIVTIRLTAPLEVEFFGPDTPPRNSAEVRLGLVRTTTVADIARYYGVRPLAEAAASAAMGARVDSVFAPLVPTTAREVAITLANIGEAANFIPSGALWNGPNNVNPGQQRHFPGPILPGSVTLTGNHSAYPARDDGNGGMVFADGILRPGHIVDYANGIYTFPSTSDSNPINESATLNAESAAPSQQPNHTFSRQITLATTGTVFSEVLDPPPAPGTLIIDYRALGKWYRLRDDGGGVLAGAETAYGTGTVDYTDGSVVATLGATPDNETAVLYSWGSTLHYEQVLTDADTKLRREFTLTNVPVAPGSLVMTVTTGAVDPVVLTFGSDTVTTSGITGVLNRATGKVTFTYATIHEDLRVPVDATYDTIVDGAGDPAAEQSVIQVGGSVAQLNLAKALTPGSLRVLMPMVGALTGSSNRYTGDVLCVDDGNGALRVAENQLLFTNGGGKVAVTAGAQLGTFNYSTGTVSITTLVAVTGARYVPGLGTTPASWVDATGTAGRWASSGVGEPSTKPATVTVTPAGATVTVAHTESFTLAQAPMKFDLVKTKGKGVVPGSVCFTVDAGGNGWLATTQPQFVDRNGQIVRNKSLSDGSSILAGSINYSTGEVSLTDAYNNQNGAGVIEMLTCVAYNGDYSTDRATFRTNGAPVRPASLYVRATTQEGQVLTGTADVNGAITGDLVEGTINQTTGVVDVRFGEWMPVAGNGAEPWYHAENIDPEDATRVWKSALVYPGTLAYSCVLSTSISLDASILGLDPVRLPMDGKVPVYRAGDVAVIHNTQSYALPNNPAGSSVHNVGRTGLTDLWLIDQDKVRVDPALYVADPAAGTITFAPSISLTGLVQPLVARHRISDMVLVTGVSIDGRLEFAAPLTQAYPQSGSYVSSALLFGDLYARTSNIFDQSTWTGAWSDERIGDPANAQFNDVLYPIVVRNDGAVQERWRIQFTSGSNFQCFGENAGMIGTGNTSSAFTPVNPLTAQPYFSIPAAGWGGGWAVGNQLRFNTHAAGAPIWLARTILPGAPPSEDSTDIQFRGDVDA